MLFDIHILIWKQINMDENVYWKILQVGYKWLFKIGLILSEECWLFYNFCSGEYTRTVDS